MRSHRLQQPVDGLSLTKVDVRSPSTPGAKDWSFSTDPSTPSR
jgi:hypothetical protein